MTNQELAATLRKAAEAQDNIALQMLLLMAADRLEAIND